MTVGTLRIGCMAAATVIAVGVMVGPVLAASGDATTLPTNFAGVASVSGVFEHADSQPGVSPTSQPFYASFGDGNSTYASQSLTAEASPYNPGATVTGLPGLICTAGGPCSGFPSYPLVATANTQHPSASVTFTPEVGPPGGQASVASLQGTAHASQLAGVSTEAQVSGLGEQQGTPASAAAASHLGDELTLILGRRVAATSSALLGVGSISGTTAQQFKGSLLTVTAEAVDSDISLLGGIIHIGSITTRSTSTSDGAKVHTHVDTAAAHDVTVGGVPASINQNGVSISGNALGGAQVLAANTALQQALAASGMQIHFLGDTAPGVLQPQTCTNGEADGLQMHVSANITPVPTAGAVYFDDIALGSACTAATVAPNVAGPTTPVSSTPGPTLPVTPVAGPSTGSGGGSAGPIVATAPDAVPSGSGTTGGGSTDSGGSAAPSASTPIAQQSIRRGRGLEADLGTRLVASRISLLYAIFALTAVAVLLGGKPFVKPRLPRAT